MSARSIRRSHQRRARRVATAAGAAIGGSALLASGAQAANFPVSNLNNAGAGSLRGAILSANASAGPDSISFTGAGASGEIVLLTEIPITDDLTINGPGPATLAVSGDSNNNNVRDFATSAVAPGDTRIFRISDPSSPGSPTQAVSISGLTLKEGVADSFSGAIQRESGGAIYAQETDLSLGNVVMSDNVATEDGGAVFSTKYGSVSTNNESLTVTGSQFANNRAIDEGGAILSSGTKYAPSSGDVSTTITNTQITGNRAGGTDFGGVANSSAPQGGGVRVKYSDVAMSGVTLSGNTALTEGGGDADGDGGGGSLAGGTVIDTVISGNVAGETAGGLETRGTRLRGSTVSGNTAINSGGGLAAGPGKYSGPTRLDNTTVSGNSVTGSTGSYQGLGGGLSAYGTGTAPGVIARSSTIAGNSASVGGGGIIAFTSPENDEPTVQLRSTIVGDNTGGADLLSRDVTSMTPAEVATGFSAGFSLVETPGNVVPLGDPNGTNLIGVDPQLGPLADNGGPTRTHALAPTSPAVDAAVAGAFTTDQRGQARTVDAAATNSALSDGTDIGAFELADPAATGDDPETEFTKKPKKKLKLKDGKKTAKVKLKFRGIDNAPPPGPMTFECKVDKGVFDECKSPLKLKLGKGKHKVEVRAIDADGNVDSSPAQAKIKVKKGK